MKHCGLVGRLSSGKKKDMVSCSIIIIQGGV